MRRLILTPLSRIALVLACVAPYGFVHAQAAPEAEAAAPAATAGESTEQKKEERTERRRNQKIERIHVEDSNAKVDELRVGGQTQNITVQPSGNMPSYEVLPNSSGRAPQGKGDTGVGGHGPAVWNVLKF